MKHEFYATTESGINGTYRVMSDFSDVNHGDVIEVSFPDKPTKILLVSNTWARGCDGCALDVIDDYCEVVDTDGTPLCMACTGTKTIFKNMDEVLEDL